MAELVVEPDVEGLLIGHVKATLTARGETATVSSRLPATRPVESVLIFRTGGADRTRVSAEPLVTVEVRAASEARAVYLCSLVVGIVKAADGLVIGGHQVYGVRVVGGVANLPDPLTTGPRYTALLAVHVRSIVLA